MDSLNLEFHIFAVGSGGSVRRLCLPRSSCFAVSGCTGRAVSSFRRGFTSKFRDYKRIRTVMWFFVVPKLSSLSIVSWCCSVFFFFSFFARKKRMSVNTRDTKRASQKPSPSRAWKAVQIAHVHRRPVHTSARTQRPPQQAGCVNPLDGASQQSRNVESTVAGLNGEGLWARRETCTKPNCSRT